jgi:hypothetical protein
MERCKGCLLLIERKNMNKSSEKYLSKLKIVGLLCLIMMLTNWGAPVYAQQAATTPLNNVNISSLSGTGLEKFDFFYAGEAKQRNMFIIRKGKIAWFYSDTSGHGEISDAILMKNGNVLFAHQFGVTLLNQRKEVIWHHEAPAGFEIHTVQPIGKEHVVFVQNGNPAKVCVMNIKTNRLVREFVIPFKSGTHGQIRHARLTAAGTLLIAHMDLGKVCEYDIDGRTVSTLNVPGVWSAVPLKNGHMLVTNNQSVQELTSSGEVTWDCRLSALSDYKITSPQLAVRLSNGNTLINNWFDEWGSKLDVNKLPVQAIEITPEMKTVWVLRSWTGEAKLGPSTTIQILNKRTDEVNGDHFGDIK